MPHPSSYCSDDALPSTSNRYYTTDVLEAGSTMQKLTNNRMSLPSLIFAIGVSGLEQPLREAHKVGIPIIAVLDSDCNPRINNQFIDYIIPGNDDSIRSYAFFCALISQAIQEGKAR
jgi:ribosomal protein S2